MMKLYSYFRSSASYRVRIALHYKDIKFEYAPIHLVRDGGQQNQAAFREINPMAHVPALEHDGFVVAESLAIIDYLDGLGFGQPLFPTEPQARARVIQLCEAVNSGIQPLQNLKVINWLEQSLGRTKDQSNAWVNHWITDGFGKLERLLEKTAGTYSFGGSVTAADCFLIPQCFASRRFKVRVEDYPTIAAVEANCLKLAAFQKAHPEKQPDYSP
jgi:maleylacetoacetate isomerase/maleylpyruvate isomerase